VVPPLGFANTGLPAEITSANQLFFWDPEITRGDVAVGQGMVFVRNDLVFEKGDAYKVVVNTTAPGALPSATPSQFTLLAISGNLPDDYRFVAGSSETVRFGAIGLLDVGREPRTSSASEPPPTHLALSAASCSAASYSMALWLGFGLGLGVVFG
jgi:hypothetical protein